MSESGIGRPSVFLYLGEDLGSVAVDAASGAGFDVAGDVPEASLAVVEIGVPRYLKVLDAALDAGVRTIVIGEDPDDFVTVGLKAAGVWRVVRSADVVADPRSLFPTVV